MKKIGFFETKSKRRMFLNAHNILRIVLLSSFVGLIPVGIQQTAAIWTEEAKQTVATNQIVQNTNRETKADANTAKTQAEVEAEVQAAQVEAEAKVDDANAQAAHDSQIKEAQRQAQLASANTSLGRANNAASCLFFVNNLQWVPGHPIEEQLKAVDFRFTELKFNQPTWTVLQAIDQSSGEIIVIGAIRRVEREQQLVQSDITAINQETACNDNRLNPTSAL